MFLRFHGVWSGCGVLYHAFYSVGTGGSIRDKAGRDMKLTIHVQLVPVLMRAAIPPHPRRFRSERRDSFTLAAFPHIFFCCSYLRLGEDCQPFFFNF